MKISIVVPVFNGQATIGQCLDSLVKQEPSNKSLEIIVVDDGSQDETLKILSRYAGISVVSQSNAGPAAARNRGVKEATGDIVLFTDADCVPGERWVEEMVKSFLNDPSVVGVKGVYRTKQSKLTARFVQLEFEYKYQQMRKQMRKAGGIAFIDTSSAGYLRRVFLEAGGFDKTSFAKASTEDIDLSFRLVSRGYRLVFNQDAYVYHQHPESFSDYIKRKSRNVYWGTIVMRRYPGKVVKDPYTPFTYKIQMALVPLGLFGIALVIFNLMDWKWVAVVWIGIGLSMLPFSVLSFKKDWLATLVGPMYMVSRAFAQALAVIHGMVFLRSSAKTAR